MQRHLFFRVHISWAWDLCNWALCQSYDLSPQNLDLCPAFYVPASISRDPKITSNFYNFFLDFLFSVIRQIVRIWSFFHYYANFCSSLKVQWCLSFFLTLVHMCKSTMMFIFVSNSFPHRLLHYLQMFSGFIWTWPCNCPGSKIVREHSTGCCFKCTVLGPDWNFYCSSNDYGIYTWVGASEG